MKIHSLLVLCLTTLATLTIGCRVGNTEHHHANDKATKMAQGMGDVKSAVAVVHPADGQKVMGTVTFTDVAGGVQVKGQLKGFEPNSKHGIHIHEFGDCSDTAKLTSAGAHFNPEGAKHGGPDAAARHAGDLGNLTADASGAASIDMTMKGISVSGKNAILGRSLIIHAKEDDLKSDPSGESGDRIGCGIIGMKKP